jgi:hypothetical protein
MRPKGRLFVEWYYTTVSSYAHPPVHNFRPYLHQSVALEVCGGLAGDVSRVDAKPMSHSGSQVIQLFQPFHSLDAAHLMRASSSTAHLDHHSQDRAPSQATPPFS